MARVTGLVFRRLRAILANSSGQLQREGQLVIEDPVDQGHCQWDAVTQVQLLVQQQYKEPYSVLERRYPRVIQHDYGLIISWVENFVGEKFRG